MGNCLISSSETDPMIPLHAEDSSFTPILPFSTDTDLGSLYTLGHELGRGQYGIIRSCTCCSSGASFACKSISKFNLSSHGNVEAVVREVRVMKHLSTPGCPSTCSMVRLHDVIEDKEFVHLILELCCGGDLYERIVKKECYSEAHAALLMKSLLETVQYCHGMGIMHRDIKPENILLVEDSDTSSIKLGDFGHALEFSAGQKFSGIAGSSFYMAPEVLQGEYSQEIDIWSAGVIMYLLLSGVPPFSGATDQRVYKAIQKGDLRFPPKPWDDISSSAKDLITKMLHPDANSRIAPAEALKHPWIRHIKVTKENQLDSASSWIQGASLEQCKDAGIFGPQTTLTVAATHNQMFWEGMQIVSRPAFNDASHR